MHRGFCLEELWKPERIKEDDTVLRQVLKYRVGEHGLNHLAQDEEK